ncbi:hypothetical protein RF11_16175 [Thelohanellus kitauei]|uniref:Uncharacterized protein n=1 Tax=Thelohanellus kitauei TaxID=669202 RepID=A0A0C2NE30_THEKT|nr:hypothetical protein RF11_16175 [Thelohanellus kitauei]
MFPEKEKRTFPTNTSGRSANIFSSNFGQCPDKNLYVPSTTEVDIHCHQSWAQIYTDIRSDFHWIVCSLNHHPNSTSQGSVYSWRACVRVIRERNFESDSECRVIIGNHQKTTEASYR